MITDIKQIQQKLQEILKTASPLLQVRIETESNFEVAGTKEVMQGKKKVDGIYFASVVPKPKDVRLYYFPIYTHKEEFSLSDDLRTCLKGKSCFHIKKISPEMEKEIEKMIQKGVAVYKKAELI